MANICAFSMKVVGEKTNVDSFVSALEQKGKFCMGRGGVIDVEDNFDGGSILEGEVKRSLSASLIEAAVSMRKQKETGKGYWYWPECWACSFMHRSQRIFIAAPMSSGQINKTMMIVLFICASLHDFSPRAKIGAERVFPYPFPFSPLSCRRVCPLPAAHFFCLPPQEEGGPLAVDEVPAKRISRTTPASGS